MIVGEAAAVAILAAATAVVPSVFAGRWLVALLGDTGRVPAGLGARFGPIAVSMGTGITLLAALVAGTVAARQVTARGAVEAIREAGVVTRPTSRLRVVGAAIGLALLAPALLGPIAAVLAAPLRRAGVSGHLTAAHLRVRSRQMAGVLVPIILFTGIATGTLYMQAIENAAVTAPVEVASSIETLNYVVVGMIALFAAVMLVNTVVAAIAGRRREFGQQRLIGSTPSQVLRLVGTEGTVLAAVGVLFGSLAAAVTVIPYSVARTGGPVPDATIGAYLVIVAVAVTLTLGSHLGAAATAMCAPAIRAVARG